VPVAHQRGRNAGGVQSGPPDAGRELASPGFGLVGLDLLFGATPRVRWAQALAETPRQAQADHVDEHQDAHPQQLLIGRPACGEQLHQSSTHLYVSRRYTLPMALMLTPNCSASIDIGRLLARISRTWASFSLRTVSRLGFAALF